MTKHNFEAGRIRLLPKPVAHLVARAYCMTEDQLHAELHELQNSVFEATAAFVVGSIAAGVSGCGLKVLGKGLDYVLKIKPTDLERVSSYFGCYQPLVMGVISASGWDMPRNMAVTTGVGASIYSLMKNDDELEKRMVTAFGSAAALSLMTGLKGEAVISFSLMLALMNGGLFKVEEKLCKVKAKADKTKVKFSSTGLGINHHAMNTLSLLTDLRDRTKIPLKEIENWGLEIVGAVVQGAVRGIVCRCCVGLFYMHSDPLRFPLAPAEEQVLSRFGCYRPLVDPMLVRKDALTWAAVCGVGSGISYAMKKAGCKEDVPTCMVAVFGSAVTLAFMSGMRGVPGVLSVGVGLAAFFGAVEKMNEIVSSKGKKSDRVTLAGGDHFFTRNALALLHTDSHRR